MSDRFTINPNDCIISNKGFIKIDGIELAELSKIEIKITPEKKTIGIMNSPTKGEVTTSYTGTIDFELHKIYSRFKPALLQCAKDLVPFNFNLECTIETPKGDGQESLYIDNCWMNGEVILASLNADGEFNNESYSAGFSIESCEYDETIDDGENWESLS